ncbi:MAG: hypothetical protein ABSC88_06125 [Terracidiphilus sp.]|jgi:predicted secreted protein
MVNLLELRDGGRFEVFCKALLKEQYPRFQGYSAPDSGMDGYDDLTETVFQFYFPERAPRKDKIVGDIRKVLASGGSFKAWVLIVPKDPTPHQTRWVNDEFAGTPINGEIWGKTEIEKLLRVHSGVRTAFFPTEVRKAIQRLAKGKRPCFGDAEEWQAISADESHELRELIDKLVDESASQKRRKPITADYSREYREFNSHFHLSSYDRLKRDDMGNARRYLEQKLHSRRRGESVARKRKRRTDGIHAIRQQLNLSEQDYRTELVTVTGLSSIRDMDAIQIELVFQHFRRKQELFESQRP